MNYFCKQDKISLCPPVDLDTCSLEWTRDFTSGSLEVTWYHKPDLSPRTMHRINNSTAAMCGQLPPLKPKKYAPEDLEFLGLDQDPSIPNVGHELIHFEIDEGGTWHGFDVQSRNMKVLLLHEDEMETVAEAGDTKLKKVIRRFLNTFTHR